MIWLRGDQRLLLQRADNISRPGALTNPAAANITPDTSPRGIKRSRSPEYGDQPLGDSLGDDGMWWPYLVIIIAIPIRLPFRLEHCSDVLQVRAPASNNSC